MILCAIGVGLAIGVVVTMPGILLALKPFFGNEKVSRRSFGKTYRTLTRKKLVEIKKVNGEYLVELTEEGRRRQKLAELKTLARNAMISMPTKWDRKWHLLVFDIPESKKEAREAFRSFLEHFGFFKFQDSVFIHPFGYHKEIGLFKEMFELQQHIYCFSLGEEDMPPHVFSHFKKLLVM